MAVKLSGIVKWVKLNKAKVAAATGIVSGYVAHTLGLGDAIKGLVDLFVK